MKPSGSTAGMGCSGRPSFGSLSGELATEDRGGAGDDWSAVAFGRAEQPASVARSAATVTPRRRRRRAAGGISRAYVAANRSAGRSRSISSAQTR